MNTATHLLADLEGKAAAGQPFTRPEAERVLNAVDLVSVGVIGESARRARTGDTVTFGRVFQAAGGRLQVPGDGPQATGDGQQATGNGPQATGDALRAAGEIRIVGRPESLTQAVEWARAVVVQAPAQAVVTGFSLADLFELVHRDFGQLRAAGEALHAAGLEAVAEVPLDRFESTDQLVQAVEASTAGGLRVWRATVEQADASERLDLIERAANLQARTNSLRAFAPLPRRDPADLPSTGYDDVRTIAVARLMCAAIPLIQVDWPLYGPKLAQVAIAFGANDIDGIDTADAQELGPRRAPSEDIARQIRAASAIPAERTGRYEPRA
jgi:aminodeoxyfutalosine synthase